MAGTRQVALTHATDFGRLSAMRRSFLDAANADRRGGQHSTGVRWWVLFCTWGRGINPILDPRRLRGDDDYRLEAEDLLEDFAVWLAVFRPSGRQIKYKSIQKYISSVRAWYSRFYRAELGYPPHSREIGCESECGCWASGRECQCRWGGVPASGDDVWTHPRPAAGDPA